MKLNFDHSKLFKLQVFQRFCAGQEYSVRVGDLADSRMPALNVLTLHSIPPMSDDSRPQDCIPSFQMALLEVGQCVIVIRCYDKIMMLLETV